MKRTLFCVLICALILGGCSSNGTTPVITNSNAVTPSLSIQPSSKPEKTPNNSVQPTATVLPVDTNVNSTASTEAPLALLDSTEGMEDYTIGRDVVSNKKYVYYTKENGIYQLNLVTKKKTKLLEFEGANHQLLLDRNGSLYYVIYYYADDGLELIKSMYWFDGKTSERIIDIGEGYVFRASDRYIIYCNASYDATSSDQNLNFYAYDRKNNVKSHIAAFKNYYWYDFCLYGDEIFYMMNNDCVSYNYVTGERKVVVTANTDLFDYLDKEYIITQSIRNSHPVLQIYHFKTKKVDEISIKDIQLGYELNTYIYDNNVGLQFGTEIYNIDINKQIVVDKVNIPEGCRIAVGYGSTMYYYTDVEQKEGGYTSRILRSYNLANRTVKVIRKFGALPTMWTTINNMEISGGYIWGYELEGGDSMGYNSFGFSVPLP